MNLFHSLQQAFANLRANKLRSVLTMLGVIIGVSAVIVLVSIVEGARAKVVSEFERLGSKLILVVYNPWEEQSKGQPRRLDNMTMDDVRAIETQCNLVQSVSAEMQVGGEVPARYENRETPFATSNGDQERPPEQQRKQVVIDRSRYCLFLAFYGYLLP